MVNLEIERGGHGPSQRLSTPTGTTVASPFTNRLASEVEPAQLSGECPYRRLWAVEFSVI